MEGTAFLGKLVSYPLSDFQCLQIFTSGVESMDKFIRGDFRLSVENHYCQAYAVKLEEEIVAIFALSFDSLDLDSDDKEELQSGFSSTASPEIGFDYQETFYAKPRYPAMDIAYLAIQEKWRGKHIGDFLIKQIADLKKKADIGRLSVPYG